MPAPEGRKRARASEAEKGALRDRKDRKKWTFEVQVKPGQSRPFLRKSPMEPGCPETWVLGIRDPAREGLANQGVVKALSEYLDIPASNVTILRGFKSRIKLVSCLGLTKMEGSAKLLRVAGSVEG